MGVVLSNNGGASIENLIISLSTEDEFTTINLSTHIIERLDPNSSEFASFSITINEFSQLEHIIPFNLDVTNTDYYNENFSFYIPIGVTVEDFETNNFDSNNWEFSGNSNWVISSESYEGNHSASSGSIANNQITELIFSTYVALDDSISFHYKVSSEMNYDYLKFYINNNEINSWSGEISWEKFIHPVNVGENIFRWVYTKDGSVNSGQDKAWIDLITFPPLGPPSSPNIVVNIEELIITMNQNETMSDEFTIFNTGTDNLQYTIETAISSNEMNALTNNLYTKLRKGARVVLHKVLKPELFGVAKINKNKKIIKIKEKPKKFFSDLAITGLYFFDNDVVKYSKQLKPSKRGEVEIVDLLNLYKSRNRLSADLIGRGGAWLDTGSMDDFYKTSNFVSAIENRQGLKIACLEEISFNNKWTNKKNIKNSMKFYGNCEYSKYLAKLL